MMKSKKSGCIALMLALLIAAGCAGPVTPADSGPVSSKSTVDAPGDTGPADNSGGAADEPGANGADTADSAAAADTTDTTDTTDTAGSESENAADSGSPDQPMDTDNSANTNTSGEPAIEVIASYDINDVPLPFMVVEDHGNGMPIYIHIGEELAGRITAMEEDKPDGSAPDVRSGTVAKIWLEGRSRAVPLERMMDESFSVNFSGKIHNLDQETASELLSLIEGATGWNVYTNKHDVSDLTKIELYAGDVCVYQSEDADVCLAFEKLISGVIPANGTTVSGCRGHIICTKNDGTQIELAVSEDDGYLFIAPLGVYILELGLADSADQSGLSPAINASDLPPALGLEEWPAEMGNRWIDAARLHQGMMAAVTVGAGTLDTGKIKAVPAADSYAAPQWGTSGSGSVFGNLEWALIYPRVCVDNKDEHQSYYVTLPKAYVSGIKTAMENSTAIDPYTTEKLYTIELAGNDGYIICRDAGGRILIMQDGFAVHCPEITGPISEHLQTVTGWYSEES